jgi:hypothetical protein
MQREVSRPRFAPRDLEQPPLDIARRTTLIPNSLSQKPSIRVVTKGFQDLNAELQTKELSLPQPWYLSDPGRWRGRSLPLASPRIAAFSCRCNWRSSTVRWCTSCSMLVQAAAASCWVVVSSTVAAVPPSLSARRDSERASRRSAVIAFADGGSGLSMSLSAMPLILRAPQPIHDRFEPRHLCRKWNVLRDVRVCNVDA